MFTRLQHPFNQIVPPKFVDVTMIAPKGTWTYCPQQYQVGKGVPCLVAVHQDTTGKALDMHLLMHLLSVEQEQVFWKPHSVPGAKETSLVTQGVFLCSGVCALMQASFENTLRSWL